MLLRRLFVPCALAAFAALAPSRLNAHEAHSHTAFSAGQPGDPNKPARVVKVSMLEDGKKMLFEPALVEVRRGEQIRFVITNNGTWDHEFMLASKSDNRKHAAVMKKFPHMEHDDPNAKRLAPFNSGEMVWRFTKRGEFEYACLIPGHLEAGMHGKVIVK
ncbi:cupredoxin domain-containing protein [Rhodoplanes sp. Z2-YC6860]|uniref:cupredoxin domain-containing protein n=1 Tax=Rhodoplanes sp. Z2-YC6860 TaxID=674703 RepID=UPI00078E93F7|nr:cupredoxin family protein [Rhodoplanes sp. Z2-YC6860]AMN42045.1 copper tolerance protein [Rhodoplanes sp. Z2-YC6860]